MDANGKINRTHLTRDAIVYIRQSSPQQVRKNHESRQRQYALVERARSLGWPQRAVKTVDEDQGRTGTSSVHREGFKNLIAEIGAGQVGIVLALEASRLARSNADWHRLVEICVVTNTLLGDETAIYDPRNPNDRLLLGVKGTISEAELFTLRQRLHEGRWNKARRGELARSLPVGYCLQENGKVVKDPDQQVQSRVEYIFGLFGRHRVARQVLVQLVEQKLKIPAVVWGGPNHGDAAWKDPDLSSIIRMLHNPTYAGAYVYGQWEYDSFHRSPSNGKATVHPRAVKDWPVCVRDAYPAYINRLVAGELEARWEQALRDLQQRQRDRQEFINQQQSPLCARDERLVKELSGDLAAVWHAETTSMEDRKKLLRFLIRRVHLDGVSEAGKIRLGVEWHTGAHSSLVIDRLPVGVWAPKTPPTVEQRIRELLPEHDQAAIADQLNREGHRSAKGLPFNRSTVGYVVRTRGWGRKAR